MAIMAYIGMVQQKRDQVSCDGRLTWAVISYDIVDGAAVDGGKWSD